jgi:hypothetical protein
MFPLLSSLQRCELAFRVAEPAYVHTRVRRQDRRVRARTTRRAQPFAQRPNLAVRRIVSTPSNRAACSR